MPESPTGAGEKARIELLLARDGRAATREWVRKTAWIYRTALVSPGSHASQAEYRRLFAAAVRELEAWLENDQEKIMEEDYTTIDRLALTKMIARAKPDHLDAHEGFALVNVLQPDAFAKEHIPWSINIPQGNEDEFAERFAKDKEIVVYCASHDCDASLNVARELARRGFTAVRDYEGGMKDWKAGGQPTVPAR